ncbi:MAG: ABC transporter permease [Chloroflexi bacterium]|nr:MAG: ABC transporter permease [Chloroflexota bacterium]
MMIQLFKMAFRDLVRNKRRSFFSSLALGMGLALLLMMASVIAGEYKGAFDNSIKLQTGHLQIRAQSYDDTKTSLAWKDLIENPDEVTAQIAALAPVKAATPRLFASGILNKGDDSTGVRVIGIDPISPANEPFRQGMVSGNFLTADDREGIVVGRPLADKLGLQENDPVTVMVNTSNGDLDQQTFIVRGVYTTGTPGYDQNTIFMPLAKTQTIARAEDHASIIFVLLKDGEQTDAVASAIQTKLYDTKTYMQLNQLLVETEGFARSYISIIYLIVLGVTATVIVNTLIMSVFERTREIGILSAIGMKSWRIMLLFFIESSMLAIGGILIGWVIGALLVYYNTNVGFYIGNMGITGMLIGERIYGHFIPSDWVNLSGLAFIITLLAALYPALLASRMEPVEALRGGGK